jgi:CheY-like chemotaxis protein
MIVPAPRTTDAKVCIVDDDSSILEALKGLLASEKIESVTLDDPERFLNHVQAHDIRVTILDVAMPGLSANGLPLEAKFPAIANAVSKLKLRSTILDGEVVAVDENGIPRFQLLQRFQKQPTAPTLYYVFDVLWCKGDDLTQKPILERRKVLERVLKLAAGIQTGSYVEAEGKALFELTKEKGMEGIIAKRKDIFIGQASGLRTGSRSRRASNRSLWSAGLRLQREAGSI